MNLLKFSARKFGLATRVPYFFCSKPTQNPKKKPVYTFWTKPDTLRKVLKTEFDAYPPYYFVIYWKKPRWTHLKALSFAILSVMAIYPLWYWQYHKSMETANLYYKGGGSIKKILPEENRSEYVSHPIICKKNTLDWQRQEKDQVWPQIKDRKYWNEGPVTFLCTKNCFLLESLNWVGVKKRKIWFVGYKTGSNREFIKI